MQEEKPGCLVDLHCGNNLPGTPGNPNTYGHVQPALQFMHLMPYIDSLWFGEGYNYDEPPEYWLIEMSGIAFGLMGDMMHAGNMWRGAPYPSSSTARPQHYLRAYLITCLRTCLLTVLAYHACFLTDLLSYQLAYHLTLQACSTV